MPDYKAAIKKVREEQPDVADVPIEPSGFFGRMFSPSNALATTNPFTGSVSYNPEVMDRYSPNEVENTFAHELTHSRQIQQQPYLSRMMGVARSMLPGGYDYNERPNELEAFQAERDRTARLGLPNMVDPQTRQGDIQLPPLTQKRKILSMFTNERKPSGY